LTRPLAGDDRLLGLSGFADSGGATPGGFPPTGLRRLVWSPVAKVASRLAKARGATWNGP